MTKNISLYAKWKLENYRIVFDLDGGTADNPSLYDITTESFTLNNPTKEGYTFKGWTGSNGSTPSKNVTITKGSTGDKRYNANYEVNSYTISFNSNDGSEMDSITQNYGERVEAPTAPTKPKHEFAGWYSDKELTKLYSFTTMPAQNITLYAKWVRNEFIINYELNDGVNDESNPTSYIKGTTKTLKPATKEGNTFKGWYKDSNFTQKIDAITANMTEDLTLHAKWNPITYYIEFETNGGKEKQSIPLKYGDKILNITAPERAGYTFKGWYNDQEFTSLFSEETMPANNLTLYANWEINRYTISFDSNEGSEVESIEDDYNSPVTAPTAPLKEGYKFAGWYSDKELTKVYNFTTIPAQNITLYAKWVDNSQNVINYVLNGGINNESNPTSYKIGEEKQLYIPIKKGNTFKGWYLDGDFKTQVDKISKDMNGNITLYAKWEANNYINVPNTGLKKNIFIIAVGISMCTAAGYFIYLRFKTNK